LGGFGVDVAKDVFTGGLYSEAKLRGQQGDSSFFKGL